jgi:hypothetical protein
MFHHAELLRPPTILCNTVHLNRSWQYHDGFEKALRTVHFMYRPLKGLRRRQGKSENGKP